MKADGRTISPTWHPRDPKADTRCPIKKPPEHPHFKESQMADQQLPIWFFVIVEPIFGTFEAMMGHVVASLFARMSVPRHLRPMKRPMAP